jgi:hypothetical protein
MKTKTIYCLVQPSFYPLKDTPSKEESINISHHLLTKHCVTVGGYFDNRYESIQEPKDVDRDFIFRLSYKKRLPTLMMDISLAYTTGITDFVQSFRDIMVEFPTIDSRQTDNPTKQEYQHDVATTLENIYKYISSEDFQDDVDMWIESTELKKDGTSYQNYKHQPKGKIFHSSDLSKFLRHLKVGDEPWSVDNNTIQNVLYSLSVMYNTLIKSERPYVKDVDVWLIQGATSKRLVEDHQHIEPVKNREELVTILGQIYKARKTWVIPYEVEYRSDN